MSSQSKIINAVNLCLKQKPNIDFELNKTGVCAGLAALYVKYALENKTSQFFSLLDQLATLPPDYRLGSNPAIDHFIIQIEKAFHPSEYQGYEIQQGDLEKILDIRNKPLSNEFSLGLITEEASWKALFTKISRNNRSYFITSNNHAIAFTFQNGTYTVYDPNYSKKMKQFDSVDELIKEIKECFGYTEHSFGLAIRAFAHPNQAKETYPPHQELHHIAFAQQSHTNASSFAALAADHSTLDYLFKENAIDLTSLAKEYLRPEFNDVLLRQPKSLVLKKALLRGVEATLCTGTYKETEKLIHHYLKNYTTPEDYNELKKEIHEQLSKPLPTLMKKKADYSNLLALLNQFNHSDNPYYQANYNHLQLLTFIQQEVESESINLFLNKLSPAQIIKQIQQAAKVNQHGVLNLLLSHLIRSSIDPTLFPSIFTREVIEGIDATTLSKLLQKGFSININEPDLLLLCMLRRDKTIFESYARGWSVQTNQSELWSQINKYEYHLLDLKTTVGSVSLLNTLVFLRKNEHIKRAWRDDIPLEVIQNALTSAILNENQEMCVFLQEKMNSPLDTDILEFLYKKGIEESNLAILSTLTHVKFNVLCNIKDIRPLLMLCFEYDDYWIIDECFDNSTSKIKKLILEYSLLWNIPALINLCVQKAPHLFNEYLHESMQSTAKLAKLSRAIPLLPPELLSLKIDEQEQKRQIREWCKKKLFHLVATLCVKIHWEKEELYKFLHELIQERNEYGINLLLKKYPQLKLMPKLTKLLVQNNLLNSIDFALAHDHIIENNLIEPIFRTALMQNHKSLVARFLTQKLITPTTVLKQPLSNLIKEAIEQGNDSIEPIIQSRFDFGFNYKELFLLSCSQKKEKIANLLLAKEFTLNIPEREMAILQLFGETVGPKLFEKVYTNGYGRLYQLLLKTQRQHPRASLLSAIKNPEQDRAYLQTEVYVSSLKRAIKEKNEAIFNSLFNQSELPSIPNHEIFTLLKDPLLFSRALPLFTQKYPLEALLSEALKQKEWAVVAHLLKKKNTRI